MSRLLEEQREKIKRYKKKKKWEQERVEEMKDSLNFNSENCNVIVATKYFNYRQLKLCFLQAVNVIKQNNKGWNKGTLSTNKKNFI